MTVESSTNLDGDLNDEMAQRINGSSRTSRQFQSHVRVSSCNDEGLAYVCETKLVGSPCTFSCHLQYQLYCSNTIAEFDRITSERLTRQDMLVASAQCARLKNSDATKSKYAVFRYVHVHLISSGHGWSFIYQLHLILKTGDGVCFGRAQFPVAHERSSSRRDVNSGEPHIFRSSRSLGATL